MPIIDYPCAQCGTIFKTRTDKLQKGKGTYCSRACRGLARRTQFERSCERCGKAFITIPSRVKVGWGRHCSYECAHETITLSSIKHGETRNGKPSKVYRAWCDMRRRCSNNNHPDFDKYGGRGISVCERWSVFENFLADMGAPPAGLSIDRIDNNGNYEPSNCRWASSQTQTNNRRNTIIVSYLGKKMPLTEAAKASGIRHQTISARMRYGWPEEYLFIPIQRGIKLVPDASS